MTDPADPMKPTMRLAEYVQAEKKDGNLFWRLQSGDHLNLLDEAIEALRDIATKADLRYVSFDGDGWKTELFDDADDFAGFVIGEATDD